MAIGAASALRACGRAKGRMRVAGACVMGASRGARSRSRASGFFSACKAEGVGLLRSGLPMCAFLTRLSLAAAQPAFATGG